MQLGWIHRGVGAGFEDNLWFKKQGSSLNPPLQNLYSTKSQTAIDLRLVNVMPKQIILKQGERYTFSQYFEMPYAPEDILAELGCTLVLSAKHWTTVDKIASLSQK